jgi:Ser/Thr protein kinase RdoA (MazF antagonist)
VADDLDLALACCAEHGLLHPDEIDDIGSRRSELLAAVDALPRQAQHGDAFPRNVLVTPAGLVWNDFEDCCSASPLWDLAVMARRDDTGLVRRVAEDRFGADATGDMIALRDLQSQVWTVLHGARAAGRLP